MSHENVTTDRQLREYCDRLAQSESIALDTEFVSEHTYRPVLCLLQVNSAGRLAMIDALAIADMTPFWETICEPGHETIVHSGRSELEFCLAAVDRLPERLLDVQIAAGLVGIEYPAGYRKLIWKLLNQKPNKEETRTDWRRRPLSGRQIEYALDDVRYLPVIRDKLWSRLEELRRLGWLEEEMTTWCDRVRREFFQERWRKVSGNSGLSRRSLAIVRELWRWRDAEAQRRNCPRRRVLRDDLIIELAKRQSAEVKRIEAVRGFERGDLRRRLPELAARIRRALDLPDDECPRTARRQHMPQLPVLGQFLFSALGSICRQANLAPALVGTPSDVRELIAYRVGPEDSPPADPPRLGRGWRAEVAGNLFDDLLAGKTAIRIGDPDSEHPLKFERSTMSDG